MKKLIIALAVLAAANLFANEPMLKETAFTDVSKQLGKGRTMMLEVGSDSCHSCQTMGKLLYKVKQEHPDYPIYFINVKKEREAAFALKIQMIPTQIIFDAKGKEAYRHIGVMTKRELDTIVDKYLGGGK